jgi:putative tryptophan/tyrosine transport system substrate-binding protein
MKCTPPVLRSLACIALLGSMMLSLFAFGQEIGVPRIDVLLPQGRSEREQDGLRKGLRLLGYIEGRTIVIHWRKHGEMEKELAQVATALGQSEADLIVTFGTPASRTALMATNKPVVFVVGDPVGSGLAKSLRHPGGRATGVSMVTGDLIAKRLELLRLLVPRMRRVALFRNPDNPLEEGILVRARQLTQDLQLQLVTLEARNAEELDGTLRALKRSFADGLIVSSDSLFRANQARIGEATRSVGLPAIFPFYLKDDQALIVYGPSIADATRRMAVYVDKIIRGAKPADLPIEQMSTYELIIDVRVARAMDIRIPDEILLRATEVIR